MFELKQLSKKLEKELNNRNTMAFHGIKLSFTDLNHRDLSKMDLECADLSFCDLSYTNLSESYLSLVDLSGSNLSHANLSGAILERANLNLANLSQSTGLIDPSQWLYANFKHNKKGWIVYKYFGLSSYFQTPQTWNIYPGEFIQETVNPCRTTSCGSGVNFATIGWIHHNCFSLSKIFQTGNIWKCRIRWEDACSIVVPYNTDGKARCGRLELLEIVERL